MASLAIYDQGTGPALYVGGGFDKIWDTWSRNIARWDGENWAAFADTFGPYAPEIDTIPEAKTMVVFNDGGGEALFVGGCFQTVGDLVVNTIAKWDGHSWSALGSGIDRGDACTSWAWSPTVRALAVFDDGSGSGLYAGGDFASAGGASASNIAKWDGTSWSALGDGVDGTIYALAVFDDGSCPALYAGGDFQAAGGAVANAIAKWDGIAWTAVLTGMDGPVYALAVYDDGNETAVYAGGDFANAGGVAASQIAKWNGTSWSAVGSGLTGDFGVRSLVVYDDGNGPALYAGGFFTHAGEVEANKIARWDGVSWSDVGGGIGPIVTDYHNVRSMKVVDLGGAQRLVIAGLFKSVGGVDAVGMAQWDGIAWAPMPGPTANGLDGWIFDLTPGDDGTGLGLFAGGRFTRSGSISLNRIGKWDGTSWTPLGTGMDGQVNRITFFDDGRGPALFAVGAFDAAGGVPANRVARWDGGIWEPLGSGLGEDRDTVFTVAGIDEGAAWGLYAGGQFRIAGGLPANYIARWDGTAWSEVGGGVGSWVFTLTAFDDGTGTHLYAGGYFWTAGGVGVNRVAKWDGVSWSAVGDGFSAEVQKLVVVDDGTGPALYAGWKHGISKWDGSQWVSIGVTSSFGPVYGIDYFDDGTGPALFAAGYFFRIGGVPARNIAKWDGSTWIPLEGDMDTAIYDLAVFNDGDGPSLFLGGDIRRTGDTVSSNIAKWHSPDIPDCISFDADAFPKNRYVSFETGVLPVELAFHVRMTASAHFPESIGDLGWVGVPDSKGTALVVPDPVFLPSWPAVVRAGDCEIVPAATYEIRATGDGVNFDPPVVVETTAPPAFKFWGDIVGDFNGMAWTPPNGVLNFSDVHAAIKTFQNGESTAPLIWVDIGPETPNRIVNFNEVLWLILAFIGEPYPFSAPADCP